MKVQIWGLVIFIGISFGDWGPNVKVNDGPSGMDHWFPSIAVNAIGNGYCVWQDNRNGNWDIYFSYCSSGGNWGPNVKLNDDIGNTWQEYPSIAVDPAGNAYCVWQDKRNGDYDIYFSYRPAGGNWESNIKVNDADTNWQGHPSIAVDASGNGYCVWQDYRNGKTNPDIYYSYRPVGGNWEANIRVNDDGTVRRQEYPVITVDSSGNAYATWNDYRESSYQLSCALYFSYKPTAGNWSVNIKIAGGSFPCLAVDGAMNAYCVWQVSYSNYIRFSYQPSGGNWNPPDTVSDDTTEYRDGPCIAVNSGGNAYAVWYDQRNGNWDIFSSYRPASGNWETNIKVNDNVPDTAWQWFPSVAMNNSGNAYCVWQDERNGTWEIYASLLPETGVEENKPQNLKAESPKLEIYPNPFTQKIDIRYTIQDSRYSPSTSLRTEIADFSLRVYDVSGQLVRDLTSNLAFLSRAESRDCILHHASTISWDGTDDNGNSLPQGIYFLRMEMLDYSLTKKVCKLKYWR